MLSDAGLLLASGHGVAAILELYAVFWALSIWRRLSVRLYRNQAFGIGIVAASFALLDLAQFTPVVTGGEQVGGEVVGFTIIFLVLVVLFYWIDASILAARRADPLLRDTLYWRRLRFVFWVVLAVLTVASILGQVEFLSFFIIMLFIIIPISGAVFLPIAARRSGDASLRRQLKWFGAFVLLLLVVSILAAPSGQGANVYGVAAMLGGIYSADYCLYKSAKSLVPLNRLSLSD
jgi:hypothetical protein